MNREQKRALEKKARKNGMNKELAKTFAEIASGTGNNSPRQDISEGDKIQLNIELIKSRKNYDRMNPKYKEFVESSEGQIFTAHVERAHMISLAEEPAWLFWSGDLTKISETETDEPEQESVNG